MPHIDHVVELLKSLDTNEDNGARIIGAQDIFRHRRAVIRLLLSILCPSVSVFGGQEGIKYGIDYYNANTSDVISGTRIFLCSPTDYGREKSSSNGLLVLTSCQLPTVLDMLLLYDIHVDYVFSGSCTSVSLTKIIRSLSDNGVAILVITPDVNIEEMADTVYSVGTFYAIKFLGVVAICRSEKLTLVCTTILDQQSIEWVHAFHIIMVDRKECANFTNVEATDGVLLKAFPTGNSRYLLLETVSRSYGHYHESERNLVNNVVTSSLDNFYDDLETGPVSIDYIPDAYLSVSPEWFILDRERRLVKNSLSYVAIDTFIKCGMLSPSGRSGLSFHRHGKATLVEGTTLFIYGKYNFYHWHFDHFWILPYLKYFRQLDLKKIKIALTLPNITHWQRDSLSLLEIDESQLVFLPRRSDADHSFIFERALFPQSATNCHPMAVKSLTCLANRLPSGGLNFGSKIYITRKDASSRRIVNEDDLINNLASRGFVSVTMSELNYSDQLLVFKQAKIVIANHGAGLTAMIAASEGTILVELFTKDFIHPFYMKLLNEKVGKYYRIINGNIIGPNGDYLVDIALLSNLLDSIGFADAH